VFSIKASCITFLIKPGAMVTLAKLATLVAKVSFILLLIIHVGWDMITDFLLADFGENCKNELLNSKRQLPLPLADNSIPNIDQPVEEKSNSLLFFTAFVSFSILAFFFKAVKKFSSSF